MKLHGLHKGRAPDVILVPPQPRRVGGKSQTSERKGRQAIASVRPAASNDNGKRRNVKTVVSRTKRSMSLTRFEKLPKTTVAGAASNGACDPMSGATVAFISKVFKVDPVKLKEEIKKKEEELQKSKGREKDIEFDPNTKLIYDYIKAC